ncbi:MAG: hypothetical protein JRN52_04890 [Nitrososphaerota archaeon]|nr:hypothetical protein [Nitrososphaerota archaeon]
MQVVKRAVSNFPNIPRKIATDISPMTPTTSNEKHKLKELTRNPVSIGPKNQPRLYAALTEPIAVPSCSERLQQHEKIGVVLRPRSNPLNVKR